jgi:MerR family transcriptional regulator, Zn(II)-responsive regulator of zntA
MTTLKTKDFLYWTGVMNTRHYYKIGELADKAGSNVETLRYYESRGLVKASSRSAAGYRLYSDHDAERLLFVLQAKKVGFSLKEIDRLLNLQLHKDEHTCREVKDTTADKISEIEGKIRDLEKIKFALQKLHDACCGGGESATHCTILQSLEDPHSFQLNTR